MTSRSENLFLKLRALNMQHLITFRAGVVVQEKEEAGEKEAGGGRRKLEKGEVYVRVREER